MDSHNQVLERLTPRESDVLSLLDQGLTNQEIAARLVLALNSVKWYARQIYNKLGVANRHEAVTRAYELGLLSRERQPHQPAHNLPRSLTSFIGREKEIDQLIQMVWSYPLVTLTGSGGVGKTRLVQVVALELLDDFADGVWYVELAALSDSLRMVNVLADSLGVREEPSRPLLETILAFFYDRQALLVLDNCEHLLPACVDLIQTLLARLPRLKLLITSRAPLSVQGEAVFRVPSLTFPHNSQDLEIEALLGFEAVHLFIERARAVRMDFQLSPNNRTAVVQICRRLDGIPLAIELAAARVRMLSVEQIAARLGQAFHLLTGNSPATLPRHRTLQALIDWSYELLNTQERTLLNRLSVFSGGWTLEAAEQVCSDPAKERGTASQAGLASDQILDRLGDLIDKSLVQFEPEAGPQPWYRMLETVRQYAHERLTENGEDAALRERHLDYCLALGQQAEPHLRACQARIWMDRLEGELDNIREALTWALSSSLVKGLQLAAALGWFWWARHRREGEEWLEAFLNQSQEQFDHISLHPIGKVSLGRAMNTLLHFIRENPAISSDQRDHLKKVVFLDNREVFREMGEAYRLDYDIACFYHARNEKDYLACREQFCAIHNLFWTAECDHQLLLLLEPEDERAVSYGEEELNLRKEIGDLEGQGEALFQLGFLTLSRGDEDQSIDLTLAALDCYEKIGNRWQMAMIHLGFSGFYTTLGKPQEATRHTDYFEAIAQELKDPVYLFMVPVRRAGIACLEKKFNQAIQYCQQALVLGKGYPREEKRFVYYFLFQAYLSQENLVRARAYLNEYFTVGLFWVSWEISIDTLHLLGLRAAQRGHLPLAITWFGAMNGLFKEHDWLLRHIISHGNKERKQTLASAHAALGEEAYQAAWEAGQTLTVAQVVQMAQDMLS